MPILGGWNHWKAFLKLGDLGFSRGQKNREGNTFVGTPSWVNQIPISLIPEIADVLAAFWESKKPSIFWSAFCVGPCSTPRSSNPELLWKLPRATSETWITSEWGFRALSIVSSNISQLVMLMIFSIWPDLCFWRCVLYYVRKQQPPKNFRIPHEWQTLVLTQFDS